MKNFLILHHGFEKPTSEEMNAWNRWFASIADKQVDMGGLRGGRKISDAGTTELPFDKNAFTGYTIIQAADLDAAEAIAQECPYVTSTHVYEIHKH